MLDMSTGRTTQPAADGLGPVALLVNCGFCWAVPGTPCADLGQHYARYLRAYRRGLLDAAGLATVSAAASYITAGMIVPDEEPMTSEFWKGPVGASDRRCGGMPVRSPRD
jgi:hypothetical protein